MCRAPLWLARVRADRTANVEQGRMTRLSAGCLLLLLALTSPRSMHGQASASLILAPRITTFSRAEPSDSRKATRTALGAVGGAVVGGVAGYLIIRSSCNRCDDNAPMLFGAAIGALAGASVGIVVSRQHSPAGPTPGEHRSPFRSPAMHLVVRVAN